MKLIGSLASPYVRKVRVVMAEKKLDYTFILENVWSPDTTIQQANPLGKVPCLIMEDGGAMFDSRVIVEYLDTLTPVGKLIPTQGRERAGVKCWEALADGVWMPQCWCGWRKRYGRRPSKARRGWIGKWARCAMVCRRCRPVSATRRFAPATNIRWRMLRLVVRWGG